MTHRSLKLSIALAIALVIFGTASSSALPPFMPRAEKYGAKDCAFCHAGPSGGREWNDRGRWLVAEKKRRKARRIDVEWLQDYKPAN